MLSVSSKTMGAENSWLFCCTKIITNCLANENPAELPRLFTAGSPIGYRACSCKYLSVVQVVAVTAGTPRKPKASTLYTSWNCTVQSLHCKHRTCLHGRKPFFAWSRKNLRRRELTLLASIVSYVFAGRTDRGRTRPISSSYRSVSKYVIRRLRTRWPSLICYRGHQHHKVM